jgi:predicted nucleic acid-binding protein
MSELVVDTSVVVKWYLPEQDHEVARALRDDYLDGKFDLVAPALLPFEAINALRYSGRFDGEQLDAAAQSLSEYGLDLVPFRAAGAVADIATDLDITVYDAAYVALAEQFETKAYTADETLLADLGDDYSDQLAHIRTYSS